MEISERQGAMEQVQARLREYPAVIDGLQHSRGQPEPPDDGCDDALAELSALSVALDREGLRSTVDVGVVDHPFTPLASMLPEFEPGVVGQEGFAELPVLVGLRHPPDGSPT